MASRVLVTRAPRMSSSKLAVVHILSKTTARLRRTEFDWKLDNELAYKALIRIREWQGAVLLAVLEVYQSRPVSLRNASRRKFN